jgi:hypothetical protein
MDTVLSQNLEKGWQHIEGHVHPGLSPPTHSPKQKHAGPEFQMEQD